MTATPTRPAPSPQSSMHFTRAEVGAGYLWLQYRIDQVPAELRRQKSVRDAACGVATAEDGHTVTQCRTSYRPALDWMHVAGVLAVGPGIGSRRTTLHIRFAPLARTPGFESDVCDVEVAIDGARVLRVSGELIRS